MALRGRSGVIDAVVQGDHVRLVTEATDCPAPETLLPGVPGVTIEPLPPPDGNKLAREKFGLVFGPIPPELRRTFGIPRGVGLLVREVERFGPAARRGIIPGDVILRINRLAVSSLEDVGLVLERVRPGDAVTFEGLDTRRGEWWVVTVPAR